MEPSLFSERYLSSRRTCESRSSGFNGALALQRGICRGCGLGNATGAIVTFGFNGALALQRGIFSSRRRRERAGRCFNGALALQRGIYGHHLGRPARSAFASMEPSLFSEGYEPPMRTQNDRAPASMEPSLFSEGYELTGPAGRIARQLLQWSPRSSARDIRQGANKKPVAYLLQWSPRSSARDIAVYPSLYQSMVELQWSPRSSARDIYRMVRNARRDYYRFNGALALQRGISPT